MLNILVKEPVQVESRLQQLGLTKEILLEVVGAMVSERNSCTDNEPACAPGMKSWIGGTRRLREILLPKGWIKDDFGQVPSAVNPDLGIKVAVCNTDDGTGLEDRSPQNRSRKGAMGDAIVSNNHQQLFSFVNDASLKGNVVPFAAVELRSSPIFWYLCVFAEGEIVRAELSCPISSESGYFSNFLERIMILDVDGFNGDGAKKHDSPSDDGGYEITISRKA